jgi:hypothetical protein
MADHDDDLSERFRSLDGVPAPSWRARVLAKADAIRLDEPAPPGGRRWRGPLAVAGLAALAALVVGAVVWPGDDDDPIVAGPAAGFGELPSTDGKLVCPPALLDVGDLFDRVTPSVVSEPATPSGPSPYTLRWTQEGRSVTLSYPAPFVRTADLPPSEQVVVAGSRIARLEYRAALTADVSPSDARHHGSCDSFFVSVAGDGGFIAPPVTGSDEMPPVVDAPVGPPAPGSCPAVDDASGGGGVGSTPTSTVAAGAVPEATRPIRDLLLEIAGTVRVRAPEGTVAVPRVTGLDGIEAQDRLARAGLVPSGDAPLIGGFDRRPVASTTPPAGSVLPIGGSVCILLEPEPTTTTVPPTEVEDPVLPIPDEPQVCPIGRLRVTSGVHSTPRVHSRHTVEWEGAGQVQVLLTWPSREHDTEEHRIRELEVNGRPALMHDGGDGQNLVYDTGLPHGACRFLQVGAFGGDSVEGREELAVELAEGSIVLGPAPTGAPPDVVGLSVAEAADELARAGFIPHWGFRPALRDEPLAPPSDVVVQVQHPPDADGVVVVEE